MNRNLIEILHEFFTLQSIAGYIGGVVTALFIVWVTDKQHHTHNIHKMRLMSVIWALMILFVGWVSINIQHSAACMDQVQETLAARAKLSDEADRLGDERDQAATTWLSKLQDPPDDIAGLKWEDSKRQTWLHALAGQYREAIIEIQEQRKETLKQRATYQVPETRCGKN